MTDNFQFDVFLSHNQADKSRVRQLAEHLRDAGLRVWFDEWTIQAGDIITLKVDEGLEQSRVLLLCISPAALQSNWVALERSTAIHRDPANAGRRFIPLLLDTCDLPDAVRRYKYLDFRAESEAVLEELLSVCRPALTGSDSATKNARQSPTTQPQTENKKTHPTIPPQELKPLAVLERKLTEHKRGINSVAVSPDGAWIASGSKDKTVKIWNLATGECLATLTGHSDEVNSIDIDVKGRQIFSISYDKTVRIWDYKNRELEAIIPLDGSGISVRSLPDNEKILIGSARPGNTLELWCMNPVRWIWGWDLDGYIQCIDIDKTGQLGITGDSEGFLSLWDLETGDLITKLKAHSQLIASVKITSNGRFAVSGSDDQTIKIWNLENKTCIGTLEGHESFVNSIAISPNDNILASVGFADNTIRLWEWNSGTCLQVITSDNSPTSVTFSPDGSRLIVGTNWKIIEVYRITNTIPAPPTEKTQRYKNAKVVLLGEGATGKTSLAHRLINDEYVIKDRTHGMNVWPLVLPQPADAITEEREALLWDLAGQEDYRLIHQLFLPETALALLLVNPQKDDPFAEAGDWLKALKVATNKHEAKQNASRLLIFSQIDVGGMKVSNAKIDRFCQQYGFTGWLPTSAKTGENCSDQDNDKRSSRLKQLIADSIPWDILPWTSTPRLLAALKHAVIAMRDGTDIRLLRFRELAQRLEQALPGEQFGESDLRTAVTLLANHGLVHPLKFGDLVLLRPDLLNGYAGAIIRAARAHTDEIGSVLEAVIYQQDFDFTGVERLTHHPDEELLLRALVQILLDHSLCIAEDTPHGRHLVFPSQYRREKDIPHEPDIFVSYTFCGEWQTVWTTLVVRLWYSQEFKHQELWRNAAEFQSPKGYGMGLKIANKQGEGEATISLYFDVEVPDELKVIFIEYVHRHLEKYAYDVIRDRRYVCSHCSKPVKDLDAVRKRIEAKKDFIFCQMCDEKIPLVDFIEQRLKSNPIACKILAMDQSATQQLDTQALEQILIGHMMAIAGEANQIFRPVTMFDYGIDGELEFKDNDGKASGKKIYVQLKSGNSYLRNRKSDGTEIFDVKDVRHLEYWVSQPADVYLVIRQKDEKSSEETIRWMNLTRYLKERKNKESRQIIFAGDKLDMNAVWKVRDKFFPSTTAKKDG